MGHIKYLLAGNLWLRRVLIVVIIMLFGWITLSTGYEFWLTLNNSDWMGANDYAKHLRRILAHSGLRECFR